MDNIEQGRDLRERGMQGYLWLHSCILRHRAALYMQVIMHPPGLS